MELFSNFTCDGHEWPSTPSVIGYLMMTYMKMKN